MTLSKDEFIRNVKKASARRRGERNHQNVELSAPDRKIRMPKPILLPIPDPTDADLKEIE